MPPFFVSRETVVFHIYFSKSVNEYSSYHTAQLCQKFIVSRETTPFDTTLESIQKYKRYLIITKSTLVSRETMDYKKNELKAYEKTVQANKERKYNKKAYSD